MDEELADQVWQLWAEGSISDSRAAIAWGLIRHDQSMFAYPSEIENIGVITIRPWFHPFQIPAISVSAFLLLFYCVSHGTHG